MTDLITPKETQLAQIGIINFVSFEHVNKSLTFIAAYPAPCRKFSGFFKYLDLHAFVENNVKNTAQNGKLKWLKQSTIRKVFTSSYATP